MDARYSMPCMIVYTVVTTHQNLCKADMKVMNDTYKLLKEEYGS
jgi:hypothetical protein